MAGFAAELYLRLAGERMLLRRDPENGHRWESPIAGAARALIAIDVLAADTAREVIEDYELALALRSGNSARHRTMRQHRRARPAGPIEPLGASRTVRIDRTIETAQWTMRIQHASFSASSTTVAAHLRGPAAGAGRLRTRARVRLGGGAMHAGGPPQATIADDRGTSIIAHFSGQGSDDEWHGRFHTHQPLAVDTSFIEVDGERIELVDEDLGVEVSIEELEPSSPALDHLWSAVASPSRFHRGPGSLEPAIDALIAAGALPADDPALDELRAVEAALQHGGAPPANPANLPDRWRSLVARQGAADGAVGSVLIGAGTPVFDGFSVAAISLDANGSGFDLSVELVPGGTMMPFESHVDSPRLAWWAVDDRENWYLGQMGAWGGGGDRDTGEIGFSPALDPRATRLDLLPTARRARARIRVPLRLAGELP
ncbi:MAG TPA: hypothetical protein VGF46_02590 [Gaiellales bacterium]